MLIGPPARAADARQERALLTYFVLVLAAVGAAALLVMRFGDILPVAVVLLLASWIPNLVGLIVTARTGGRSGLRELLTRVIRWRFNWRWYAIAVLLPVVAVLLAGGIGTVVGLGAPSYTADAAVLLPLLLFNVLAGPLGEELGWRGTALPRLLVRWTPLTSSILLGIIWWIFHTPGFLLGLFPPGFTPIGALVGAVALTVLITWMFTNTGGSLIPGSLMHLSINFAATASGVAQSPALYGLTAAMLALAATIVAIAFRGTQSRYGT
jgi:uncharacterized protein